MTGGFRLEAHVGQGGQGTVWRAIHEATSLPVAIKRLHRPDERLAAELDAVASLDHEAVVGVVDFSLDDAPPWIAFEWMSGGALVDTPPRDWDGVVAIARRLLAALAHAHARGVVHRDVKPDNVLLDYAGLAVLGDFGLAGAASTAGTAPWKAPEQVRGATVGPAADLYGLGGTLWWCVAGEPPFGAGRTAEAYAAAHLSWPLPPLATHVATPPGFEAWLRCLLARDPAARFPSAPAALAAFEALGPPTTAGSRPWPAQVVLATATATGTSTGPPAPGVDQPPEPGPRCEAPLPATWRRPGRRWSPALAAAGLRLLRHHFPPELGREAERDHLWRVARNVAETGVSAEIALVGPPGSGRSHLARWLQRTVAELAGSAVQVHVDGPGSAGPSVTVRCLLPGEGPGDAIVLQPLDAAIVRAGLVRHGFAPPAAARLAAHAYGHPGALVEVVEALQRDGGLAATATGLQLVRPGGAFPRGAPRLERPPDPLLPAVSAAALLGPRVDPEVWRATASGCDAALPWLVERRLVAVEPTSVAWVDPWAMVAARGWADVALLAAAAGRITDPVAAAETWLAAGRPEEAVAVLTPRVSRPGILPTVVLALWEEAAALAPAPRAVRVTGLVHRYFERLETGAREEAEDAARRALAEADGATDVQVMALTALAGTDAYAGRLALAWDRVEAACAVPDASDEVAAVCWGLRGQLAVRTGRWALAVPSLERAVALRVTDVRRVATLLILARTAVMAGDLAAAASALARAEPLLQPEHRAAWHEVVGRVRWATRDLAGAEEAFREALRLAEDAGTPDQELPLLQLARCALGDRPALARSLAERALRAGIATGRAPDVAASCCILVVALAKLGAEVDALGVLAALDLAAFERLVTLGDRTLRWDLLLAGAGPHLSLRGRMQLDAVLHRIPPDPRDLSPPHRSM